ncbi:MAG: helix-turn-helix transcriptional regulator [Lachnospiraceae bacterium]|nr:helix-turn-helix transcriptional regulator [Lachnospiraceae bacterium]
MIVYDRLWETIKEKGITKYYLTAKCGLSPSLITRLKRNQSIRMDTINTLCEILDCNIEDIAEYKKD